MNVMQAGNEVQVKKIIIIITFPLMGNKVEEYGKVKMLTVSFSSRNELMKH